MERLKIDPTPDTPKIIFDQVNNLFEISQRSFPEDAIGFYMPVHEWMGQYIKNPNSATVLKVMLEYYNTASAKQLFRLFSCVEELSKTHPASIEWYYKSEDSDMKSSGERFARLFKVKIAVIEY